MKKLLSEQLVDYLERRDTKCIFGLCGHTVIAMLDALEKSKNLKYISLCQKFLVFIAKITMKA